MQHTTTYYSALSGACAATASLFGKLSGLPTLQGPLIVLRVVFFILMIICNGGVWTLYVKALQATDSSLSATVLSAASNYFLSALIGFLVFGEVTSLIWWSGMMFVLVGLMLIANDQSVLDETKEFKKNR
ncbi:hypothetical protein ILUMI_16296 [Ignelater luminosus]|uniref:EamA domain-containing protein n=1 Tax=Ignelater luminosus TaxID=2038154 RepID=A0A8K0CRB6_IGNLU|nr:hypothetical protein ILUMI_16296 [Ignelater luminosus]